VTLAGPGGRTIAVTSWQPRKRRGTIVFSHGALSSPAKYDLLILPWVAQGFEVWAPLHVDSLQHPDRAAFAGLKSWAARIEDMHVVAEHAGRNRLIAAGHSYGGLVALTLAGARVAEVSGQKRPMALAGVNAAVAFSPPGPMPGFVEPGAYAGIAVPALIQTGTADLLPPGKANPDPASWHKHLMAYDEAAPGGHRYALVLDQVDHYFGGAICDFTKPGPPRAREAGIAAQIAATFLRGYGCNEAKARRALDARRSPAGPVMLMSK
jgi:pimeloyl-ACP methyl ester carboxylesterase